MYTSYYTANKLTPSLKFGNKFELIKYLFIDVDGTLTDGSIYYGDDGIELKKFNSKDAAGFFSAKVCGINTIVITGRESDATRKRMEEMQVSNLIQGVVDKVSYIKKYMRENSISKDEIAYIGDDLNDYSGMLLAGFKACPSDAASQIKDIADYVSPQKGGEGAFRDIVEYILKQRGQLETAYNLCYHINL